MAQRKNVKGSGTIRKKTVTRNGKEYTYWEARVTTGRDPGTGKQVQRSFTGKTQKEVREKMRAAAVEVNHGPAGLSGVAYRVGEGRHAGLHPTQSYNRL